MSTGVTRPKLIILPGDGIGPELAREMLRVVAWLAEHRGFDCEIREELYGVTAFDRHGVMIREEVLADLAVADAVFFGAIGSVKEYAGVPAELRRRWGTLRLRQELQAFASLRPIRSYPALSGISPLRPELIRDVDMVVIRELTGGLYVGEPRGTEPLSGGGYRAVDTQVYTSSQIERVARLAFALARERRGRVTSVDKAGVLETGVLWRNEVQKLRDAEFPQVELNHVAVDTCAIELMQEPRQFDVLLADSCFGDILSDEAVVVTGSLGMLCSASLAESRPGGLRRGFYEPLNGSSPSLVGRQIANPIGAILALAQALEHSFGRTAEARLLESAVARAIDGGSRTADIVLPGEAPVSTPQMTDAVLDALDELAG